MAEIKYVVSQTPGGKKEWIAVPDTGLDMVYPSAGIALSTGSAWGTSITNNSANWNTAYGWGNWASNFGSTAGKIAEGNHNHDSSYEAKNVNIQSHIANNDQAHSDYLKNNANDSTSGTLTASDFILS